MGTVLVPETSENIYILTLLSALGSFIEIHEAVVFRILTFAGLLTFYPAYGSCSFPSIFKNPLTVPVLYLDRIHNFTANSFKNF